MILLFILFNLFVYSETAPLGSTWCIHEGRLYQKGELYKKSCNHCVCEGFNEFDCTQHDCNDKTHCYFHGKTYRIKKQFRYDCRDCMCLSQETIRCSLRNCTARRNKGFGFGFNHPRGGYGMKRSPK